MDVAIVGCGMIADAHVQEIRKIGDTNIVGVCDREPLIAEQLADRYGIPRYYQHIEELIEVCHPEVVHILTPPGTHHALGLTALDAGCHVLMEKPFTISLDETKDLIEKAKSVNRRIIVNHFHNFSPPSLRLREMIREGVLGNIVHIESFYGYSMKSPVATELLRNRDSWLYCLPGKLLHNNIDHLLCKIVELITDDNPKIMACGNRLSEEAKNIEHSYLHDELRVMLAGETTSAYATFSANIKPFMHFMVVYGTKNTVSIDYESRTIVYGAKSGLPGSPGKLFPPFHYAKQYVAEGLRNVIKFARSDFHYYSGMSTLLKLYYNCIRSGDKTVPIEYDEIIRLTKIIDEIIRKINE